MQESRDIFSHLDELQVTEPSFIVASGPSGRPYYDLIPPSKFIAGINAAIVLPLQYNLWVCTTPAAHFFHEPYWAVGINSGVPSLMREEPASVPPHGEIPMQNETATYTMRGHSIRAQAIPENASTLDEGASSVGVMAALLIHCGVTDIITCGLEFQGIEHFDGTPTWKVEGDIWNTRRRWFNKLIDRAAELGVRIRSLHPVHPGLNLEVVPPERIESWQMEPGGD